MNLGTKLALAGGVVLASTFLIYTYAKDGGKKKYQIIHQSNGEMITYDTIIPMSSDFTPEQFLEKKGISSKDVEIIMLPSASDQNIDGKGKKTIVKEMEVEDDGSGDGEKVEINVEVDANGKKIIKKTVNGKEVKLSAEEQKMIESDMENDAGKQEKVVKMKMEDGKPGEKEERVEISVMMDDKGKKTAKKMVNGKEVKMTDAELKKMESEMEGDGMMEKEISSAAASGGETTNGDGKKDVKIIKKEIDTDSNGSENNFEWSSADGKQKIMLTTTGDEDVTLVLVTENYDEKTDGKSTVSFKQSKKEINVEMDEESAPAGPFKIKHESDSKEDTEITVTNEAGKKVFEEKLKKFSGKYEKEVDLKKFGTGLYTITIKSASDEDVRKIKID